MIHIITVCISVGIDVSIFSGAACYTSESRFLLDNNGAVDVPSKYGIPSTLKDHVLNPWIKLHFYGLLDELHALWLDYDE